MFILPSFICNFVLLRGFLNKFLFLYILNRFYLGIHNALQKKLFYTNDMPRARKKAKQIPEKHLNTIGRSLQSIRKRRGLTQQELGDKIGLTREAIASYEAGRSHLMDTTLLDMAAVLRVSVNDILGVERRTAESPDINRRWAKRMEIIEGLPESVKKHILRTLDDVIKANTRMSIFEDK